MATSRFDSRIVQGEILTTKLPEKSGRYLFAMHRNPQPHDALTLGKIAVLKPGGVWLQFGPDLQVGTQTIPKEWHPIPEDSGIWWFSQPVYMVAFEG
jgi:hypothetical protein